ncbi:MAG: LLM class flavin-dependent oxidoreductase [Actinomycetota bacterium]|nr:LLM class flavin-dependent oxidoreductase [Actinomycetota bacterium]
MDISCEFLTAVDTPEHAVIAEDLGFKRVWVSDTPQMSPDVWLILGLVAAKTSTIEFGPAVLVPSLRHPMVNAAGTAAVDAMAPGRLKIAFGTGFTARRAMGNRAITWAYMDRYIRAYRGLLHGDVVEWEGTKMQMLHPDGHGTPRPVDVPILIGALGPKGQKAAHEHGDGLFVVFQSPSFMNEFAWTAFLTWGTVLDDDEPASSEHAKVCAGPGWALAYHAAYEFGGAEAVSAMPGGEAWLGVVEQRPPDERHLAVHAGHCVHLNEADEAAWRAGGHVLLDRAIPRDPGDRGTVDADDTAAVGTPRQIRQRLDDLENQGVTEIVFMPCGSDVRGELERFMKAAQR